MGAILFRTIYKIVYNYDVVVLDYKSLVTIKKVVHFYLFRR